MKHSYNSTHFVLKILPNLQNKMVFVICFFVYGKREPNDFRSKEISLRLKCRHQEEYCFGCSRHQSHTVLLKIKVPSGHSAQYSAFFLKEFQKSLSINHGHCFYVPLYILTSNVLRNIKLS